MLPAKLRCPLLAVVLTAAACSPESGRIPKVPAASGPALQEMVGFATQLEWGTDPEQASVRRGRLDRLASIGNHYERIDFTWALLEQKPGEWDFSGLDAAVEDARDAGVEILAMAGYGNPAYPQAGGSGAGTDLPLDQDPATYFPPEDPDDYARFVETLVEHYRPLGVTDYELWNEENIGYRFFRPKEDPDRFGELIARAATRGRSACPECRFVIGGLSVSQPIPYLDVYEIADDYADELFAAHPELDGMVDGLAFHPYQYPKDPPEFETAPFDDRFQGSLETQTENLRAILADRDVSMPLWITENGWPTNPGIPTTNEEIAALFGLDPNLIDFGRDYLGEEKFAKLLETLRGVPEEDQARYLVRSTLIACSLGIEKYVIYALDDYDVEPEINQESAFGVFGAGGREKPAAQAVRTLLTRFGGYRFSADVTAKLGLSEPSRALAFRDGDDLLFALWRWKDGPETVTLQNLPGPATLVAQDGTELATGVRGDPLEVPLGPDVVYLEIAR